MAGLNTRFHDAGFDIPKYLLPWDDHTVITEILKKITKDHNFDEIYLLPNKRDRYFRLQLLEAIEPLGLTEENICYIGDTSGQAHTALIGASLQKNKSDPFFIHNADTIITNRNIAEINESFNFCSAWIDAFVANSPAYSYIKIENEKVVDIVEKKPISPYASSGFYCFASATLYEQEFYKAKEKIVDRELYVSDILKNMIDDGQLVWANELNHNMETIVLGSPQEYGIELAKKKIGIR
jgi:dTDP-glucose pyrophosphorylase